MSEVRETQHFSVVLPKELVQLLRVRAALNDETTQDVLVRILEQALKPEMLMKNNNARIPR